MDRLYVNIPESVFICDKLRVPIGAAAQNGHLPVVQWMRTRFVNLVRNNSRTDWREGWSAEFQLTQYDIRLFNCACKNGHFQLANWIMTVNPNITEYWDTIFIGFCNHNWEHELRPHGIDQEQVIRWFCSMANDRVLNGCQRVIDIKKLPIGQPLPYRYSYEVNADGGFRPIIGFNPKLQRRHMHESGLGPELMANRFHPRNMDRWPGWGYGDMLPEFDEAVTYWG